MKNDQDDLGSTGAEPSTHEASRTVALIPSQHRRTGPSSGRAGDSPGPNLGGGTGLAPSAPDRPAVPEGLEQPRSNGRRDADTGPEPASPGSGAEDGPEPTGVRPREVRRLVATGVAIVVLGALVGFGASWLSPTEYAGQASVLYIISQEQPTGFLREDRNLTTQAMLAQSNAVLAPVAAQYGLSPAALAEKVTVTVPDGSELLNFRTTDPSPDLAVRLADSVTKQYLQTSASSQPSSDQMRYLQGQLTAAQNQIQQLRVDGSAPALAQLPAVADRAGSLNSQLDTLMLAQVAQPQAQIVVPAYPGGAVSPRPAFGAATGAVCGLLVALATVAVLAWRWRRRGPGS